MKNYEVASLLRNIAQFLEIKEELVFKIRAYEKAALVIENLDEDIEEVWKKGKLDDIPGVGEALTKKISEFLETGKLEYYETVVDYLQEVVKSISNRSFQIKNAIEWRKFEAGV